MFVLTYFVLCDFKLYVLFHIMITIIIIIRCSSGYTCTISVVLSLACLLARSFSHSLQTTARKIHKNQFVNDNIFCRAAFQYPNDNFGFFSLVHFVQLFFFRSHCCCCSFIVALACLPCHCYLWRK